MKALTDILFTLSLSWSRKESFKSQVARLVSEDGVEVVQTHWRVHVVTDCCHFQLLVALDGSPLAALFPLVKHLNLNRNKSRFLMTCSALWGLTSPSADVTTGVKRACCFRST